jgi:hypothetical protein
MRSKWVRRTVFAVVATAVVFGVAIGMGEAVEQLWNWLMPGIFGLRTIGFWQALGLMGLSWILFCGPSWLGPRPRRYGYSNRMAERWEQMTPEQRATFREGLRGRCGPAEAPK